MRQIKLNQKKAYYCDLTVESNVDQVADKMETFESDQGNEHSFDKTGYQR